MVVDTDKSRSRINKKLLSWGATKPNILMDYSNGIAIIGFSWKGEKYEFRYTQKNATVALSQLSWSLARLIDCDIRGILPFSKTGREYLSLSMPPEMQSHPIDNVNPKWFSILGTNAHASNEEIKKQFKQLAGMYHPDRAINDSEKPFYEKKMAELNEAFTEIKKGRQFQ